MKKLPQLPYELILIICEYAYPKTKFPTYLLVHSRHDFFYERYYLNTPTDRYGYNTIESLTLFLYKEIYDSN